MIGTRVGTGDECTVVIEDGLVDESREPEPEPEPAKTDWASAWGASK